MNVIGIIAEYNPLHNGHIHHIQECKKLYPNSILILVLNGYFMQRGELSIVSKEDKTSLALDYGIDIVLELPFVFGTQSADIFASKSIEILNHFKVDTVIFGSESNDIDLINKIADIQLNDTNYNMRVKEYLDKGLNYPTAMSKALEIDNEINNPNDLLGISYVKAIKQLKSSMVPCTIQRTNDYHDTISTSSVVSASNIRTRLLNGEDISNYVPPFVKNKINTISETKMVDFIKYKITTDHDLNLYLSVDEGIEYRLKKYINKSKTIDELISFAKTKRYTHNKIRRMLIHILVGLTKDDIKNIKLDYIKILGFNKYGKQYLNKIKKNMKIKTNIVTSSLQYKYENKSAIIYSMFSSQNILDFENKNIPIKKYD